MAKPEAYIVDPSPEPRREKNDANNMPEPLSGSKEVKNRNHKGQRHGGEGF
jgi:small acid-soluble spore protein P (minor)